MVPDLASIPLSPGIYIFKDAKEKVLYVGKAKILRNRIRSYFHKSSGLDMRKSALMQEVQNLTYIVTGNELEAFVLEANLIKQYKPRFNVILRDDKNYPYLKLTLNEEWPRLEVVRRIRKDGARYFGPYVPAGSMWETLAFIRRNFLIRDCRHPLDKPMRPCIQHQMGRCLAPCAGHVSRDDYLKLIEEIRLFLSGGKKDLMAELEERMSGLSDEMKYEEAAKIRDRIRAIEKVWESQKVVSPEIGDLDVLGFYRENGAASFQVFFIRNGIMVGSKDYLLKNVTAVNDKELLHTFLTQLYSKEIIPPAEIIAPLLPEGVKSLGQWLSHRREEKIRITSPKKGKKKELIEMASENARFSYGSKKELRTEEILNDLKERLQLEKKPDDIGAFDVSTLSGNDAVGSFVYWSGGEFKKNMYRRLKIRTVRGVDDYSMMAETVERIIDNLAGNLPGLVIIDGGKGHLETVRKVISGKSRTLHRLPELTALAKDPDRLYRVTADEPIDLEDRRPSSLLLKSIRDEAHRFAVGYHRTLRDKEMLQSPLTKIRGIGKKRRLELLRVFGSIKGVKDATIDEIAELKGFNKKVAENLYHELRRV
jgi:excinuclease ABC subunit C